MSRHLCSDPENKVVYQLDGQKKPKTFAAQDVDKPRPFKHNL
jgi:hypothetical protein